MSDQPSDADRIREKRLAKIQQQAAQNAAASKQEGASAPAPPSDLPSAGAKENPFNQLQKSKSPSETGAGGGGGGPRAAISITPAKRDPPGAHTDSSQSKRSESLEIWEHKTLSSIFRITLDQSRTTDAHGTPLAYLPGLHSEMEDETPPRLTVGNLDGALLEAASNHSKGKPLDYLLPCWRRVSAQWRGYRSDVQDDPKKNTIAEARRLCMSYCIFAITMPEMFMVDAHPAAMFAPYLLLDVDSDKGVNHDFLAEVINRFEEDDSIQTVLVSSVEFLSRELATKSMVDDYQSYTRALRNLVRFKPLVTALSQSPSFCPAGIAAQNIETHTLLGPFFRLSPMQGQTALSYFSGHGSKGRGFVLNTQNALRMTVQTLQGELFDIADSFIKAGAESRNLMLDWFAMTVNLNHRRRAMRPDERYISSDGFMCNVTVILDRLCEPFMDAQFSKIGRIEAEYFRRSPRVDIKDETKINADQSTADAFYGQKAEGTSNFISEVFFLTMAAHHYGTEAAETKLSNMRKELKRLDAHIDRVELDRAQFANNPLALARYDAGVKRLKDEAEKGHCVLHAIEGILMDELLQSRSMSFMRYVIVWLVRMVTQRSFPAEKYDLPLPAEQPDVFKCLPEYFIEDVVDHFKFITSHMPHVVSGAQCDELVTLCITFMRSSDYIKNPGVKAGLVTILYYGVMPVPSKRDGLLGDVLNGLPFALKHLLHALMQAYIECESTGSHTQFYDKFNIRYEIFQVIKNIWKNDIYHDNLKKESQVNPEFFIQFVNMILNDTTFVLDESFTSFNKISSLTRELRPDGALDETQRKEKEEALEEAKGKAKSYMQLTTESIDTLILFTNVLAESFTAPEVVQRLADMLDYNLEALVGPKSSELKVENPEQYKFHPAQLLGELISVYLNLSSKRSFAVAVARDGRSYKHANFETAVLIQRKHNTAKPAADLDALLRFADVVQAQRNAEAAEEADLGDAPDEFLDPLLATIMEDPVILPVSRTVMDRSTIRQHLLSDPHDPFNRSPLKIEDVLPAPDVREQIQRWKREKLAARRAGDGGGGAMDTSA